MVVNLLPIFSKIIEKHVETTLRNFLNENSILSKLQFGFKSMNSTIDALVSIIYEISSALNRNQKCVLLTFDLKSAFDVVDHNILINKLSQFCAPKTTDWFKSFLSKRVLFVSHNNSISDFGTMDMSVCQGDDWPLCYS